jgi:uncharacterized protein YidB (DUF937 family)
MSNRMPSLAALLGLVAVAGYQNRDKIGDFIKGLQNPNAAGTGPGGPASPARPEQGTDLSGSGYAGGAGGAVLGGLGDLLDQFRTAGQGRKADSWVSTGQNETIDDREMEQALGPDLLDRLTQQTGLSREELLSRLAKVLPQTVDHLTPEGRLPQFRRT